MTDEDATSPMGDRDPVYPTGGTGRQDVPPPADPGPARRLTRSRDDRVIAGVCGGLARYFNIDPLITRIAAFGLIFLGGVGVVLYLAAWFLVPEDGVPGDVPARGTQRSRTATIAGVALAAFAVVIMLNGGFWVGFGLMGPLLSLALVGAVVWWLIRNRRAGGDSPGQRLVLGIAVLILSAVAVTAGFAVAGFGGGVVAAALVVVAGLAIIASSFTGGARWLILPAIALACGAGVATASDVDLRGDYGERYEVPRSAADLPADYDMGAGSLRIDLREVAFPAGERVLDIEMGMGEVVVVVPPGLCVVPDTSVRLGEMAILGRTQQGVDLHRTDSAVTEGPRLVLRGDMGMGSFRVTTDPYELERDHGDWEDAHDDAEVARRAGAACAGG